MTVLLITEQFPQPQNFIFKPSSHYGCMFSGLLFFLGCLCLLTEPVNLLGLLIGAQVEIFSGSWRLGQLHHSKVHHSMDMDWRKLHPWRPQSGFQAATLFWRLHLPATVVCSHKLVNPSFVRFEWWISLWYS